MWISGNRGLGHFKIRSEILEQKVSLLPIDVSLPQQLPKCKASLWEKESLNQQICHCM